MAGAPPRRTLVDMSENASFDDTFTQPTQPPQSTVRPAPATRTFRRSRTDRMVAGLCGGLAETLGVDATLLRVAVVALTVLGSGAGAIIYLICWLVVPEADLADPAIPTDPVNPTGTATTTVTGGAAADRPD
jgi:phage shock protein PspC (stress-responsive transcriptional regulator)